MNVGSTTTLQPLDKTIFRLFKEKVDEEMLCAKETDENNLTKKR
jgi:hypothetical protein